MNWTDIAGPVAKAGAPIIGGLLGGPAGAAIGGRVGDLLGAVLNVPPTPEAVQAAIVARPGDAAEALTSLEASHGGELIALAQAQLSFQAQLARDEKTEGWTGYGWRRLAGWSVPVLGLWQLLIGPVVTATTGATVTADFSAFVAYAGIVTTFLMGGHTLKEVLRR